MNPLLKKLPNTLTRLEIHEGYNSLQLSSITKLTRTLNYHLIIVMLLKVLKKLQYVTFPQLEILNILRTCPNHEELTNFLENNGKKLKELHVGADGNNSLNLIIAKFCPNLKKLFTKYKNSELKTIFNGCQYLEIIKL